MKFGPGLRKVSYDSAYGNGRGAAVDQGVVLVGGRLDAVDAVGVVAEQQLDEQVTRDAGVLLGEVSERDVGGQRIVDEVAPRCPSRRGRSPRENWDRSAPVPGGAPGHGVTS